jgi:tRNA threonylcarbamoyl adenosine modification protein (Sua5/YciO/YrdC/YwlC family)
VVGTDAVQEAIDAIRAGKPVLLPTDTVYGLCASAFREAPVQRLYALKGRGTGQPSAILAASVAMLFECVPELRGRAGVIARTLLPGPYTLVLENPARRYPWANGEHPDTIGVRVADLPGPAQRVLDAVGAVAATSANEPGEPPAASLDAVPERIRSACGAELDAGRLAGSPSTVIDFTGEEPVVLRDGAGDAGQAIARVHEVLAAMRAA